MGVLLLYPRLLARGGWRLVFGVYGGITVAAAACLCAFTALDARDPTIASPLEVVVAPSDICPRS